MEIICDSQIKKEKKRNIHSQTFRCCLKLNKTEGESCTLSVLAYVIKPDLYFLKDRILVLAKQEQNNATVFGVYVLVLLNEIRAASLCHDTQPKVCKYMKERRPIKMQYANMTSPQSVKF